MILDDVFELATTHTRESSIIPGLWLSRSGVLLKIKSGGAVPIFGFSAEFDRCMSERKSVFELLEHLSFHPEKPLLHDDTKVWRCTNVQSSKEAMLSVDNLLLGASAFGEILHGNGCAVHSDMRDAVTHAQNEILERHYCCEMWYNRTTNVRHIDPSLMVTVSPDGALRLYEVDVPSESRLVIATLESETLGFFGIGASMRGSIEDACAHSIGEVAAIFEDAKLSRSGHAPTATAKRNILSLRDRSLSHRRKYHFQSLLGEVRRMPKQASLPFAYTFKVAEGLFAARASPKGLLTPRRFHTSEENVPILPLF